MEEGSSDGASSPARATTAKRSHRPSVIGCHGNLGFLRRGPQSRCEPIDIRCLTKIP